MRTLFPDGQLDVNLRVLEAQALDPFEVLGRFLRALSVEGNSIPDDVDERVDLYRSLMADLHAIVLLDNAADEARRFARCCSCRRRQRRNRHQPQPADPASGNRADRT